jgi:hypothetical protein
VVVSVAATSSLSASFALAFTIAFFRVFVAGFFLDVFVCLLPFGGGEDISAQSEPGDVDPPDPSSAGVSSWLSDATCTFFEGWPFSLNSERGGVDPLAASFVQPPECTRV